MVVRNTRAARKSPSMFYIRNTRGASPFLIEMTNTGEASVDHSRKKRSYYLRNTRAGHSFYKSVPGKKVYYLRNTRGPTEPPENYVRNGRDWFMRNTRSGHPASASSEVMAVGKRPFNPSSYGKRDFYIRNTRTPDKRNPANKQWYIRNTRGGMVHGVPVPWCSGTRCYMVHGEVFDNPESKLALEEDDPLEEDKYIRNTRVPKPSLWEMRDTKQGQNVTFS